MSSGSPPPATKRKEDINMTATQRDQIITRLLKSGVNPEFAAKIVDHNADYIARCYPDATVRQMAEIVMTVGMS